MDWFDIILSVIQFVLDRLNSRGDEENGEYRQIQTLFGGERYPNQSD
jgi:hypothetical protein